MNISILLWWRLLSSRLTWKADASVNASSNFSGKLMRRFLKKPLYSWVFRTSQTSASRHPSSVMDRYHNVRAPRKRLPTQPWNVEATNKRKPFRCFPFWDPHSELGPYIGSDQNWAYCQTYESEVLPSIAVEDLSTKKLIYQSQFPWSSPLKNRSFVLTLSQIIKYSLPPAFLRNGYWLQKPLSTPQILLCYHLQDLLTLLVPDKDLLTNFHQRYYVS